MILYSRQSRDFNIVRDRVDLSKSSFYSDSSFPNFKSAYEFLFKKLGTREWIWCRRNSPYFSELRDEKSNYPEDRIWVLDVPDKHIVCVDISIWHFIINDLKWFGSDHFYHFVDELGIDEKWVDILNKSLDILSKEETWKKLIRENKKDWKEEDEYLVKSPISKRWIVGVYNLQQVSLRGI